MQGVFVQSFVHEMLGYKLPQVMKAIKHNMSGD